MGGKKPRMGSTWQFIKYPDTLAFDNAGLPARAVRILCELLGVGLERGRTANCSLFLMHIGRFNLISTSNDILRKVKQLKSIPHTCRLTFPPTLFSRPTGRPSL